MGARGAASRASILTCLEASLAGERQLLTHGDFLNGDCALHGEPLVHTLPKRFRASGFLCLSELQSARAEFGHTSISTVCMRAWGFSSAPHVQIWAACDMETLFS